MDITEAAAALDGNEYGKEGSAELFSAMRDAGLVAIFGYSDDVAELRGAIDDEVGASTIYLTENGLYRKSCEDEYCPHEKTVRLNCRTVEPRWCDEPDVSWTYRTDIPHKVFHIMEDGDVYCRGIVFYLGDAA